MKSDTVALRFAQRHPRTPLSAKIAAVLIVAYGFSPVDRIPDFVAASGFRDEVMLLPPWIWFTPILAPDAAIGDCRRQARAWMDAHQPKPQNCQAATVFIPLWPWLWLPQASRCWLAR